MNRARSRLPVAGRIGKLQWIADIDVIGGCQRYHTEKSSQPDDRHRDGTIWRTNNRPENRKVTGEQCDVGGANGCGEPDQHRYQQRDTNSGSFGAEEKRSSQDSDQCRKQQRRVSGIAEILRDRSKRQAALLPERQRISSLAYSTATRTMPPAGTRSRARQTDWSVARRLPDRSAGKTPSPAGID